MASTALSIAVLSAGVTLMLVAAQFLLILWALRRDARDNADQERAEEDGGGVKGMSADELETLPCHDYGFFSGGASADCAVCLEAFEDADRCRLLPRCAHSFHARCVDPWLQEKSRCCPVCRADAVLREELVKVAAGEGSLVPALTVETGARAAALEAVV